MLAEVVLGVSAIALLLWILCKKPSGLPPGRWGLPLVGYIPMNSKYIDDQLQDFQKQYGDLYIWRIGTQVILIVHDYHLARQLFSSQDFIDRPDWDIFKWKLEVALGVGFSNGPIWHSNRKFAVRQLRDLGMGKSIISSAVETQALKMVENLKEKAGNPTLIPAALNMAVVNVIWQMVASKQFESDNPRLLKFKQLLEDLSASSGALIIPDIFPWLRSILPTFVMHRLLRMDLYEEATERFLAYFHEIIEEHRAALDPDDPKDLIDSYLIAMDGKDTDMDHLRSEKDLTILIFDLFIAGSDTTIGTMKWIFLYMAAFPDVQRKFQKEIDQVVAKGTLVTNEDRVKLPYTEAVIHEVHRMSSLINIGLTHCAARDTQVQGYTIPKGTLCIASIDSIHHDPRYWDKPDQFLPERWLDAEGKFTMKKEGFMPFSTGKRSCIGESLARLELLIMSTAVFQTFNITPVPGKMIDLKPDTGNPMTHDPRSQEIIFALRESC